MKLSTFLYSSILGKKVYDEFGDVLGSLKEDVYKRQVKNSYISANAEKDNIFTEIDNELNFKNSSNREEEE